MIPAKVIETRWLTRFVPLGGCVDIVLQAAGSPMPVIKRVRLAELRNHLPTDTPVVTPKERVEQLRARVRAAQRRRRW